MDTVLVALIVITVVLVSILTLAYSYLAAQEATVAAWQTMEARVEDQSRTDIVAISSQSLSSGAILELTIENTGSTKLADFDQWDVIVQYYSEPGNYYIEWLPYTSDVDPGNGKWTVVGIYLDAATVDPEIYEPNILNPGEQMIIRGRLLPPVGLNTTNFVAVSTPNGICLTTTFTR